MLSEEDGIKAILALQKLADIDETQEQAREGWNLMSDQEKEATEQVYKHFCCTD